MSYIPFCRSSLKILSEN